MTILRLIRIDFDSLENNSSDAISSKAVLVAMDDPPDVPDGKTAFAKVRGYLQREAPSPLYLSWTQEVYPQWKIVEERVV